MADGETTGTCLLVVDDESGMRDTLLDIMEAFDLGADEASNGQEAVDKVRTGHYDLVLMDIKMPVMDGVQALAEIKRLCPNLPVIMMTAYAHTDAVAEAERQGAEAILSKPLNIAEVMPLIQKTIEANRER
jgi:CheY-like chemotaxis protein